MDYKQKIEEKRQKLVDTLIDFIEKNPTEWEAGWYNVPSVPPFNGKTQKKYNGLNSFYLCVISAMKGYKDPRWVTFNQAKELGANVRAGEKASEVFYWSYYDKLTKQPYEAKTCNGMTDEERKKYWDDNVRPVIKFYQVFNAAQCDNIPAYELQQATPEMEAEERRRQNAIIEQIITNSAAPVNYDGGNRAHYSPSLDSIHLPEIKDFKSMQDYYATALHEIAHSTGHESRLNRDIKNFFGTPEYAKEELRAELASVFMQVEYGISVEGKHFENHGAYLASWLKSVKNNQKEFFAAASDAEKITSYVADNYLQEHKENEQESEPVFEEKSSFAKQVDAVLSGADTTSTHLKVMNTPLILRQLGAQNLPVLMTAKHLKNIIADSGNDVNVNYHGLDADLVKQLPELLADPVMVMDSMTRDDSVVVVTSAVDSENRPIIGAIKFDGFGNEYGKKVSANILLSLYGRNSFNEFIRRNINEGSVLYWNKEKSQELIEIPGVQFPDSLNSLATNIIIRQAKAFVNTLDEKSPDNFENNLEQTDKREENAPQALSPLYTAYMSTQEENPEAVVLQRLGDFYEVMGDKAQVVAEQLELTLTSRDVGLSDRIPMIGFPTTLAENYITQLRELADVVVSEENSIEVLKQRNQRVELSEPTEQAKAEREHNKPLVVNFYAGPGAGKTTAALELTAALKKAGYNVEYVQEYAKELVLENKLDLLSDQRLVTDEQFHRIDRLRNSVDVIVTDSPVLLGQIYGEGRIDDAYRQQIRGYYDSFDNFNLYVTRGKDYQQEGRIQTSDEAKALDGKILTMLKENDVFFGRYKRDDIAKTVERIGTTYQRLYGAQNFSKKVQQAEQVQQADNDVIYGVIYDWKGLKEENSLYTVRELEQLDENYIAGVDEYDGAFAANKTYRVRKLSAQTEAETLQNIKDFLTGEYNILPPHDDWYWETVSTNLFNGAENATTLEYIKRLKLNHADLTMNEEINGKEIEQVGQAEQVEQVQIKENTKEKYIIDFKLKYSNELLLGKELKELGFKRDLSVSEVNHARDAAAFNENIPYWTNGLRYIGNDGKTINGTYGKINKGILIEATDITRFTLEGMSREEAEQIADILRGFDIEVSIKTEQAQQANQVDAVELGQQAEQAQQAEQVEQAHIKEDTNKKYGKFKEGVTYYEVWWSESKNIRKYFADYFQFTNGQVEQTKEFFDAIPLKQVYEKIQQANKDKILVELLEGEYQEILNLQDILKQAQQVDTVQQVRQVEVDESVMYDMLQEIEYDYFYGAIDKAEYNEAKAQLKKKYKVKDQKADTAEPVQQAKQAEQVGQGKWRQIPLDAALIGAERGKSTQLKLPDGEYSSFVFFAPTKFVRQDEKSGAVQLSVNDDFKYTLMKGNQRVELTGSELRRAMAGQVVGQRAQRVLSEANAATLTDLYRNVPQEMRQYPNWCVYQTRWNEEKGKKDKLIFSPVLGLNKDGKMQWASIDKPETWGTFDVAMKFAEENDCAGLVFALDGKSGISCIDLDKSVVKNGKLNDKPTDMADGEMSELAAQLSDELHDTYIETSASGNGIHIFVKDDLLAKGKYKNRAETPDGEIEVYDDRRFMSMTGNLRSKTTRLGKSLVATTAWLQSKLGAKVAENQVAAQPRRAVGNIDKSDNAVMERIRRSAKGSEFEALYRGENITGDNSRNDFKLLNILAFFTDCDENQMERLFKCSGLYRENKGDAYVRHSVRKACATLTTRMSDRAFFGGKNKGGGRGNSK